MPLRAADCSFASPSPWCSVTHEGPEKDWLTPGFEEKPIGGYALTTRPSIHEYPSQGSDAMLLGHERLVIRMGLRANGWLCLVCKAMGSTSIRSDLGRHRPLGNHLSENI
jgi:hypothetical protein